MCLLSCRNEVAAGAMHDVVIRPSIYSRFLLFTYQWHCVIWFGADDRAVELKLKFFSPLQEQCTMQSWDNLQPSFAIHLPVAPRHLFWCRQQSLHLPPARAVHDVIMGQSAAGFAFHLPLAHCHLCHLIWCRRQTLLQLSRSC